MIEFQSVSKAFGAQVIVRDASIRVGNGERVGIVGANGSGKSTLFALLRGELSPDAGEILVPQRTVIGHLRQRLTLEEQARPLLEFAEDSLPELRDLGDEIHRLEAELPGLDGAGREATLARLGEAQTQYEHLGGYEVRHRAESALSGLGFNPEDSLRPLAEFSGGWQMRAELARVVSGRPDVLCLDEPTNFLDLPAVEWLNGFLADFPGTLLLISHDRYLLNRLTKVTVELCNGMVTRYAAPYDEYVLLRDERVQQLQAARRNQEKKREQTERFIERFRYKATKANQVQSRVKMLEKMETIHVPEDVLHPPVIRLPQPQRAGAEVIRLAGVSFAYADAPPIYSGLDFSLQRGERAAIVGYNGSGKTTLLRLLAGRLEPAAGKRTLGHNVTIGYLAQESAETMPSGQTVFEVAKRAARADFGEANLRSLLGALRFGGDTVEKSVDVLSGGERMRLALARILVNPPNLLFLDEPTTHLDIASRKALEDALQKYGGTLCLVSHDVEFVRHVATRVFEVRDRHVVEYFGGYDYFREKKAAEERGETGPAPAVDLSDALPSPPPPKGADRRKQRRERAQERQRLSVRRKPLEQVVARCEHRIEELETEQQSLAAELGESPSPERVRTINSRLTEIPKEVAAHTEEWETAATKLEAIGEL